MPSRKLPLGIIVLSSVAVTAYYLIRRKESPLPNQSIYRFYAPIYDRLFGPILAARRKQSVQLLGLQPGERLLISGVGTGLDLPLVPAGVSVVGVDISTPMLTEAAQKPTQAQVQLHQMDAQHLELPAHSFDAALLNLILSVAPDSGAVLREAWRVLRPGGRVVIFDKFLPEDQKPSPIRNFIGAVVRLLGTDPNRRFSDLLAQIPAAQVQQDIPALLRGQYRIIVLEKAHTG